MSRDVRVGDKLWLMSGLSERLLRLHCCALSRHTGLARCDVTVASTAAAGWRGVNLDGSLQLMLLLLHGLCSVRLVVRLSRDDGHLQLTLCITSVHRLQRVPGSTGTDDLRQPLGSLIARTRRAV